MSFFREPFYYILDYAYANFHLSMLLCFVYMYIMHHAMLFYMDYLRTEDLASFNPHALMNCMANSHVKSV